MPTSERGAAGNGLRRVLFALALAGNLGGCAAPEAPPAGAPGVPGGIATPPAAASPLAAAAAPIQPLLPAVARMPGLERLHGMIARDLALSFGAPDLLRRDGSAEIWQYRAASCVLDIFLYAEADELRVAYAEARPRGAQRTTPESCAAVVAGRRAIRSTGL
jgi:hypothetical protein